MALMKERGLPGSAEAQAEFQWSGEDSKQHPSLCHRFLACTSRGMQIEWILRWKNPRPDIHLMVELFVDTDEIFAVIQVCTFSHAQSQVAQRIHTSFWHSTIEAKDIAMHELPCKCLNVFYARRARRA